jgi:hypothetical protein
MGSTVGGIIVTMIDHNAWFGRTRAAPEGLKKLQRTAPLSIPSSLSEDHRPNHAAQLSVPLPANLPSAESF